MADVRKSGDRVFVGRAWVNTAKDGSAHAGTRFLTLRVDRGLTVTLTEKDNILLWPNTSKREGKQDADFNVSVSAIEERAPEGAMTPEMALAEAGV